MKYVVVGKTGNKSKIAILCPRLQPEQIHKFYYDPYLVDLDQDILVCDLYLDPNKKKTPAAQLKEYLNDLIPALLEEGIELVVVTQPDYFKVLTKQTKTDSTIGDILETVLGDKLHATYCPNYSRAFYDLDKVTSKIKLSMDSVYRWSMGDTTSIGSTIISYAEYPKTNEEIIAWLEKLQQFDCNLTVDVESFSLKHYDAGIGTITFCWNKHEGVALPVDYSPIVDEEGKVHGKCKPNHEVRAALKRFFEKRQHKTIYHNICFDVYVLVYQLFMDHILDQEGLLYGLDVMLRNWDCTQLLTYLATNSCAGNELGLKIQAQEYTGNYAKGDIHDITRIPLDELLEYNLIDGLATWHVYNKHLPTVISDKQMDVYNTIFKPAVHDIIQMQLTGLPINMDKVQALDIQLKAESQALQIRMNQLRIIESFTDTLNDELVIKKNASYKKKVITKADLGDKTIVFNPNSADQLQRLLYSEDFIGLPILDYTKDNNPATGAETLEKLIHHTKDPQVIGFLQVLIEYKASATIISTFLPAFLKAELAEDGWHYLFGNFKLGGTVSARLSSSGPNLQNIPASGSGPIKQRLAKLIKECFEAPPGWLFVGVDFDSLEDKISAVTTRDPEKIKVYSDGFDGHCLRALAYFPEQMPDIELCPEGEEAYKATINGADIYFHAHELIHYLDEEMTGAELYVKLNQKEKI